MSAALLLSKALVAVGASSHASVGLIDWSAYTGAAAVLLSVILLVLGLGLLLLGRRISGEMRLPMPGRAAKVAIVIVWAVSIFLVLPLFKQVAVETGQSSLGTGPVFPITLASALGTFVIVAYVTRGGGMIAALGNGLAAAVAGQMLFELPFILIITPEVVTPVPHPLFLFVVFLAVILTTLSLPLFSSRFSLTRYSFYLLGAMFVVFALWAFTTGYAPPADPVSFSLNAISKVLGFAAVAASFSGRPRAAQSRADLRPVEQGQAL